MKLCNLLPLAGPIATIIAAAAAVFVTWRLGSGQLRIAKQQAAIARQQAELATVRLQHDLFDRRFAVYEAAHKLLLEIPGAGNVSAEVLQAFDRETGKSVFLLNREITDYLSDIRKRAYTLHFDAAFLADPTLAAGSERSRMEMERQELTTWFIEQFDVLIEKFKPALTLDRRQP